LQWVHQKQEITEGRMKWQRQSWSAGGGQAPKISVVSMSEVTDPALGESGKYAAIYGQICGMPAGSALKVEFGSNSHALYARAKLRTMVKADTKRVKCVLSSSKADGGATRFFWLDRL